jgi:parvulin-like peptidyl-prolyl isomerase
LSKKQKRIEPKHVPTKHQLSKWERERKIRRIIIAAAAVFLSGTIGYAGYGYYESNVKPLREVVIDVNEASFTMDYYIKQLDAYTKGADPSQLSYMSQIVANQIVQDELIRQGAHSLGVAVTDKEIDDKIEENGLPDEEVYREIVSAGLLREKLQEYFASQLPDTMEQTHTQIMLVESQKVAYDVIERIESGNDFAALMNEFSCNFEAEGDLGWLPRELISDPLIGDVAFNLEPGEIQAIHEESADKNVGYWLIEVTEKDEEKGIRARAMLLGSRQEADEVKAQLTSESFAELADKYSQYVSEEDGGELGWIEQGDMNSLAFDAVAFSLDLNVISEPVKDITVQTKGGYWIVQVIDKGDHELSEDVRKDLTTKHANDWFEGLEDNSTTAIYLDNEKTDWAIDKVLAER